MQFCKRCLYGSNHPLGIIFNEEGICSGCIVHEEKDQIDWGVKLEKLKNLQISINLNLEKIMIA